MYLADIQKRNHEEACISSAGFFFVEAILLFATVLDTTKRRELYYQCQAIVNDDGGALVPMFANLIMALDKGVRLPVLHNMPGIFKKKWALLPTPVVSPSPASGA